MKISDITTWLTEAKRYFASRSTGGEDSAHWSNVTNSEMCEKIVSRINRLDSHNSELLEANTRYLLRARQSEQALKNLLEKHVTLVNSGDCGNWDPEKEDEVIEARNALDAPWQ